MSKSVLVMATIRMLVERLKSNQSAYKAVKTGMIAVLAVLLLIVYTIIVARYAQKIAIETYRGWLGEYIMQMEREAQEAKEHDPYTIQLNAEADLLAKVLYGVKDNDNDDLRTYCWCVFNRVDNNSYPNTLEDVIAQPNQWMRYDQTNPILEDLYEIAREELDKWHSDSHRPVSNEYVFMNWSANDICLRDRFSEGSGTHYWRYGQK